MKKENNTPVIKLSERFDKELLNILSAELRSLKNTKNAIIKKLNPDSGNGLMLA